jgi:hypothetical protein
VHHPHGRRQPDTEGGGAGAGRRALLGGTFEQVPQHFLAYLGTGPDRRLLLGFDQAAGHRGLADGHLEQVPVCGVGDQADVPPDLAVDCDGLNPHRPQLAGVARQRTLAAQRTLARQRVFAGSPAVPSYQVLQRRKLDGWRAHRQRLLALPQDHDRVAELGVQGLGDAGIAGPGQHGVQQRPLHGRGVAKQEQLAG